jgi:hypothetical protein
MKKSSERVEEEEVDDNNNAFQEKFFDLDVKLNFVNIFAPAKK